MLTLGISAYYHDSAAALLRDGVPVAAAQEERFTRKKHDSGFPGRTIEYCLSEAGCSWDDIDDVVFYDKPFLKFERLLETYLAFAPRGFTSFRKAMPVWLKEKLFQRTLIETELRNLGGAGAEKKLLFAEHHLSHAASAYFPSPFDEAVILTMDGVGEWATTSVCIGRQRDMKVHREIHFPHSLGLLYSAFTYYTGFKVNSGEYKLMGLAPYGQPRFAKLIQEKLIDIKPDGSFRLDMQYFDYCTGLTMTNNRFDELFGQKARMPEQELTQFHMDIASSIQAVTEEVVLRLTRSLAQEFGIPNLCLAGGVALNCVANGKVLRDGSFEKIWMQPAAGDAGGALGAAFAGYHLFRGGQRKSRHLGRDDMQGSYLGPAFSDMEIAQRLERCGARFHTVTDDQLLEITARALAEEKAIGWFQGRMEFGPRALGGRSILGDPRSPTMQKMLNLKIKYRESFRPFAPSVLREDVAEWFELYTDSPYMLLVADVAAPRRRAMTSTEQAFFGIDKLNVLRSEIPAVTHVDYSARIQTVHADTNPRYYNLLKKFKSLTGCPVLVNTSFNVRGEPIVCTPEDAFRCLMGTGLDQLSIGNIVVYKAEQEASLVKNYAGSFELD